MPEELHDLAFPMPFSLADLLQGARDDMRSCNIGGATFRVMEAIRATNKFLTVAEPWKLKGDELAPRRRAIVRTTLEAVYIFSHFLAPVCPHATQTIFDRLGTQPKPAFLLKEDFYNLAPGTQTSVGEVLFKKIETEADAAAAAAKKAALAAPPKKKNNQQPSVDLDQPEFSRISLRVGRIKKVWAHENADRLYCEEIDVGEDTPRTVASGLRDSYSLEEMMDRLVLVVCNLKESKMMGFPSQGMVLASKAPNGGRVELVEPPAGAQVQPNSFTNSPYPLSLCMYNCMCTQCMSN